MRRFTFLLVLLQLYYCAASLQQLANELQRYNNRQHNRKVSGDVVSSHVVQLRSGSLQSNPLREQDRTHWLENKTSGVVLYQGGELVRPLVGDVVALQPLMYDLPPEIEHISGHQLYQVNATRYYYQRLGAIVGTSTHVTYDDAVLVDPETGEPLTAYTEIWLGTFMLQDKAGENGAVLSCFYFDLWFSMRYGGLDAGNIINAEVKLLKLRPYQFNTGPSTLLSISYTVTEARMVEDLARMEFRLEFRFGPNENNAAELDENRLVFTFVAHGDGQVQLIDIPSDDSGSCGAASQTHNCAQRYSFMDLNPTIMASSWMTKYTRWRGEPSTRICGLSNDDRIFHPCQCALGVNDAGENRLLHGESTDHIYANPLPLKFGADQRPRCVDQCNMNNDVGILYPSVFPGCRTYDGTDFRLEEWTLSEFSSMLATSLPGSEL